MRQATARPLGSRYRTHMETIATGKGDVVSCHTTPGNNLHLNLAQYLTHSSPADRTKIESTFHRLVQEGRRLVDERALTEPSTQEALAYVDRLRLTVRHDPTIPDARRTRLLRYCGQLEESIRHGEGVPSAPVWYAWTNLASSVTEEKNSHRRLQGAVSTLADSTQPSSQGIGGLDSEVLATLSDSYANMPSQSELQSAHNSYHVWRKACFMDENLTELDPARGFKWEIIEEMARRRDRASGISPAARARRLESRRTLRSTVDPSTRAHVDAQPVAPTKASFS